MNEETFLSIINGENKEVLTENANMNSDTPSGMMYKLASETSKEFTRTCLLSNEAREAVEGNYIHIHDMDYYPTKSLTCLQHPLDKILKFGFRAGHGASRPAKRIETATMLACISMETIQNEMHGGQAFPAFDFYLAPYVKLTFKEELKKVVEIDNTLTGRYLTDAEIDDIADEIHEYDPEGEYGDGVKIAIRNTVNRVHQAMESFVHNCNTIHSRGGNQVVFSSINYGTDISPEGRCIIRELLKATERGVGNGETPIFPIQIWKLKKGVSAEPGDPNYDLLQLAYRVTAKRFFPNFINLDAPFNHHEKWNINDPYRYRYECATMGCRTRVFEDRHGEKTPIGRGNLSFTTINLPRLALESGGDLEKFYDLLFEYIRIAVNQLVRRYEYQRTALKKQFPLLMSGMWQDSAMLKDNDSVADVLKHGTLSVGFIGLAECLTALTGKHHGESWESQRLGLEIIESMSCMCRAYGDVYNLNISLLATPAEGLSGKFVKKDRADFGVIPNVTDRDYYTNSNHVPVWYKCTMEHKMKVEAPYHPLTPAGHIAYLEVDGDPEKNVKAVEQMVNLMRKYNIGYGSINHARARCLDCGYESGSDLFDTCPKCNSTNVDVLERITGYLVGGTNKWNNGKKSELKDRVSHMSGEKMLKTKQI
jgi:ribonucleoside-triphosphate reductase